MCFLQYLIALVFLFSSPSDGQLKSPSSKEPSYTETFGTNINATSVQDVKHKYIISLPDYKVNWHKARDVCESFGLEFASILSEAELTAFKEAFLASSGNTDSSSTTSYIWLGGSDLATHRSFVWTTNPPKKFLYANWMPGKPDDSKWKNEYGERCLLGHAGKDYLWNDYPCDEEYQFACKTTE